MTITRRILCARRADLPSAWTARRAAVSLGWEGVLEGLRPAAPVFVERPRAEGDPSFKQLIPYLVVAGPGGTLACYPRQGAEARLHGLWSVGIGGHVDPPDAVGTGGEGDGQPPDGPGGPPAPGRRDVQPAFGRQTPPPTFDWRATLERAARRELAEELPGVPPPASWECLGVINEELTAVGTVHLGVVLRVRWDGAGDPAPTEELHGLRWVAEVDLRQGRVVPRLEIWSELAMELPAIGEGVGNGGSAGNPPAFAR